MFEIFKGALGSHLNYLTHIALDNCKDYLWLVKAHKEDGRNQTRDKFKRLRFFLNAIESLNNVPEYFFHEHKDNEGWSSDLERTILGDIRSSNKILRDIEQIANATKHYVRRNSKHIQAQDLQAAEIKVSIDPNNLDVQFNFDSIEDERIITEAFKFWVDYLNNPDKGILIKKQYT